MDRCCPEACVTVNLREMARQQQASATAPHTSSWVYFCVQPVWQWLCVIHEMVILADSPRSSSFLHWCAWLCKVMWGNSFSALSFSDVCTIFGFINLLKQWFSLFKDAIFFGVEQRWKIQTQISETDLKKKNEPFIMADRVQKQRKNRVLTSRQPNWKWQGTSETHTKTAVGHNIV